MSSSPSFRRRPPRLHAARWESRSQAGDLGGGLITFHQEVIGRFLAAGGLVLTALRVGERTAAVAFGFLMGLRMCLYLMGMESSLEGMSPGALQLGDMVEEAIDVGLDEVDLLRGAEVPLAADGSDLLVRPDRQRARTGPLSTASRLPLARTIPG